MWRRRGLGFHSSTLRHHYRGHAIIDIWRNPPHVATVRPLGGTFLGVPISHTRGRRRLSQLWCLNILDSQSTKVLTSAYFQLFMLSTHYSAEVLVLPPYPWCLFGSSLVTGFHTWQNSIGRDVNLVLQEISAVLKCQWLLRRKARSRYIRIGSMLRCLNSQVTDVEKEEACWSSLVDALLNTANPVQ